MSGQHTLSAGVACETISIVIPVFNEAENLRPMYRSLIEHLPSGPDFEIILVDDGSSDGSAAIAEELHRADPRVKLVQFSRNFGQQMALTAGLDHAQGDAVITMDADLQHPSSLLPAMLDLWRAGYQVVHTVRQDSADVGFVKRWTSRGFYWVMDFVSQQRILPGTADFRLLDRQVVEVLSGIRERHRFLRGLTFWVGFRQTAINYEAANRHAGRTKYSFWKMMSFAVDGLVSFSSIPLRLSTYLGLATSLFGLLVALWAVFQHLATTNTIQGWTSTFVSVLVLGGAQLVCLGVIGEYLGRIYEEIKQRPLYIVQDRIGWSPRKQVGDGNNGVSLDAVGKADAVS